MTNNYAQAIFQKCNEINEIRRSRNTSSEDARQRLFKLQDDIQSGAVLLSGLVMAYEKVLGEGISSIVEKASYMPKDGIDFVEQRKIQVLLDQIRELDEYEMEGEFAEDWKNFRASITDFLLSKQQIVFAGKSAAEATQ